MELNEPFQPHAPIDRTSRTDDERIEEVVPLPPPESLIRFFPIEGTPVESFVADTRRFQVRAFVEELDAASVQPGMPAQIFADGMAGRELRGRVVRLSPRMGRKELRSDHPAERFDTKTREVWIELEGVEPLVVGLRVDVIIHLQTASAPDAGAGQLAAHSLQRAAAQRTE